jgi:hypothetical protein
MFHALSICLTLLTQGAQPLEKLSMPDIHGHACAPLKSDRTVCLIFVLTDCPIANQYAPEIKRIVGDYQKRGVDFYLVDVDEELSTRDAVKHAREYGFQVPTLLDPHKSSANRLKVTVSPEAVVWSKSKVQYRGRIDDLFPSLGIRRQRATVHDLRDALSAVLAGKPVPNSMMPAVGCVIATAGQ